MDDNRVSVLIEEIIEKSDETKAFFKFDANDERQDYSIMANKDGILLFVSELLKTVEKNSDEYFYPSTIKEEWYVKSEFDIDYIRIISEPRSEILIKEDEHIETITDKMIKLGCLLGFGLMIISMIVGFKSILEYILK